MSLRLDPDLRAPAGPEVESPSSDPLFTELGTDRTSVDADGDADFDPAEWALPDAVMPVIRVTAILVCHDGAAFLPRTLDAIQAQSRVPDHLVAVDAGSLDGSDRLLAVTAAHLLRLGRHTCFGDAVQAALAVLDANALTHADNPRPGPAHGSAGKPVEPAHSSHRRGVEVSAGPGAPGGPGAGWIWLLHDDSAPAPDALQRLIEAADGGPSIGIAGCKQVSWDDDRRLLDVGFTTSRLGARVSGIDVGDVDQGQLDHRSDVLAVGTAGMLIRRDVWDRLGGTDPALGHTRDDVDLCRRAHLAGVRVVVVPTAVIAHAAATASGRRGDGSEVSWALRDRRSAVHLRLASVPLLLLPLLVIWLCAAALLRAITRLALKQPSRAGAELVALGLALARPLAWLRARRRLRSGRELSRRDFRRLLATSRQTLRQRRDLFSSYLLRRDEAWAALPGVGSGQAEAGYPDADSLDEELDEEWVRPARSPGAWIGVAVAVVAGLAGVLGLRLLLRGTGVPIGPALIPVPETAGQLWALAMSSWRPVGLGRSAVADPFDALLTMIAWPLGDSPGTAVELLLLGALPLSAGSAWWAAGGVTRSRALRAWAALGWAAAPPLLGAVAAGRLGAIVAHLALPPTALLLARTVGARPRSASGAASVFSLGSNRGRGSIGTACAAGLLLAVLIAAAPSLAAGCLVAVLGAAVVAGRRRALLACTAAIPGVLLLPWWFAVGRDPRLLLAEPGGASATAAEVGPAGWHLALWPADPAATQPGPVRRLARLVAELTSQGDATVWLRAVAVALAVPLVAIALSALLRRDRVRPVGVCWAVGLAGLAIAALAPALGRQAGPAGGLHGWSGAGVSLFALALFAAALCRLDGAAGRLRARTVGWRHGLAIGTGIVAVIAPLIVLSTWTADGWAASPGRWVHRGSPDVLPAVAAAEAEGPAATRTLVLKVTPGGIRWSLDRAGGPRLGQDSAAALAASAPRSEDPNRPLLAPIGRLLSDSGGDPRASLAALDVGSILLLAPIDDATTLALDTAPGLVRVAAPNGGVLWRVQLDGVGGGPTRPARVRVLSKAGQVLATLPSSGTEVHAHLNPGPAGRKLVLSERIDSGWQASVDGRRLEPSQAGWAQAFVLPTGGGELRVRHVVADSRAIDLARLGVLGFALLLAVPGPRRRRRLGPPLPARAEEWEPPVGASTDNSAAEIPVEEIPAADQPADNQAADENPAESPAAEQPAESLAGEMP